MHNSNYKIMDCLYLPARDVWWGTLVINKPAEEKRIYGLKYNYNFYWCWWAKTNGEISVKKHYYNRYTLDKQVTKKVSNKYERTDIAVLYETWADFNTKLEHKMLFERLKGD